MSELSRFLKQNKKKRENEKYIATKSITDENGNPLEWEIKPIRTKEIEDIRSECVQIQKNSKKQKFDSAKFNRKIAVAGTAFPNLDNKELQDSYGVYGAEQLIQELLDNAGEYDNYVEKILEISGYDKDIEEIEEEAKN